VTDGLVAFLRARLRSAAAYAGDDLCGCNAAACQGLPGCCAFIRRDVEAKRRIIDLHAGSHECSSYDPISREINNCQWVMDGEDCTTLRLLALPYANHPDYRHAWRPQDPAARD
jgi:hypothetical protein